MEKYFVTAFDTAGTVVLNDSFEAENDKLAKERGLRKLQERDLLNNTSRIVRSSAGLIYFHQ